MRNEKNGVVSVHGNRTVNKPILIFYTGLLFSHEMCGRHMLKVFSILEELATIMSSHRAINFLLGIYTN
jgi:hypothetical protein